MSSTEFWHLLEEKNKGEGLRRFKVNLSPLSSSSWNARRCFISLGKSSFGIKRRRQQRNCSTSIMAFALLVATKDGNDRVSNFVTNWCKFHKNCIFRCFLDSKSSSFAKRFNYKLNRYIGTYVSTVSTNSVSSSPTSTNFRFG